MRKLLEPYNAVAESLDDWRALRVGDDEDGLRVADDVLGLRRSVFGIHQDHATARPLHSEEGDDPVQRARRVKRDPVLWLDAQLVKASGYLLRLRAQVIARQRAVARPQHDIAARLQQLHRQDPRAEPPPY